MFQPSLVIAGAGLDDGGGRKALGAKSGQRLGGEIVEQGEPAFAGGPEVEVPAVDVAVLEIGKHLDDAERR